MMRRKSIFTMGLAAMMTMGLSITAFAGQWQTDANGWWWQREDGSYPANSWEWIDGNADGTAECYYFNDAGYMLVNTVTPDGYTVNAAGQWVVDGTVKTQAAGQQAVSTAETEYASFVKGYERAVHAKFNSPASENGLGGTDIYIEATLDSIDMLDAKDGVKSILGYFSDSEGNRWVSVMHAVPLVEEDHYANALGKQVIARGVYRGFSGTKQMPSFTLDRLLVKETGEKISGMAVWIEE